MEETARLTDLFGEPGRWADTFNPLQLATIPVLTPSFTGSVTVPVTVPLTYDLDIAAARYLHGLDGGEVPLTLLFSATLSYRVLELANPARLVIDVQRQP